MRDSVNLAREFYGNPNLCICDVRPAKLIDSENITSRFQVNIRLYEHIAHSVWKLVFGTLISAYLIYIKNLDGLANHWECVGCQQRFSHHDNYNRHVTKNRCTSGKPKLICDGGKFKHIMNSSETVFYGGNTQFLWKACRWIEYQSKFSGWHIHHALCSHGGEKCMVINKKKVWSTLKNQPSISSANASDMDMLA